MNFRSIPGLLPRRIICQNILRKSVFIALSRNDKCVTFLIKVRQSIKLGMSLRIRLRQSDAY